MLLPRLCLDLSNTNCHPPLANLMETSSNETLFELFVSCERNPSVTGGSPQQASKLVTKAEYASGFQHTKDTPYLALAGELWGAYCGNIGQN